MTTGETDDRKPLPKLLRHCFGKVIADKGYISKKLYELLFARGIELITKPRKNMKERFLSPCDRVLLRKRAIIESVIDPLKNVSQVEPTRHRAATGFLATGFLWNVAGALIAYCHQPKKPSLHVERTTELLCR